MSHRPLPYRDLQGRRVYPEVQASNTPLMRETAIPYHYELTQRGRALTLLPVYDRAVAAHRQGTPLPRAVAEVAEELAIEEYCKLQFAKLYDELVGGDINHVRRQMVSALKFDLLSKVAVGEIDELQLAWELSRPW